MSHIWDKFQAIEYIRISTNSPKVKRRRPKIRHETIHAFLIQNDHLNIPVEIWKLENLRTRSYKFKDGMK